MTKPTPPEHKPYGIWDSPISPALLSQSYRLDDVQWDSDGSTLVWLEGRSDRGVLVAKSHPEAGRDLTVEQSVRGGIGYGGGDFVVAAGVVVFSGRDGRLYRRRLDADQPQPITPPFGAAASAAISPDGDWVVYVFSDGSTDLLALVDSLGSQWPLQLARGANFYMQPVWHPAGKKIAWVEWHHPNMPWDGARLILADIDGNPPRLVSQTVVAGDDDQAVWQPQFSPDGRWLSYIVTHGDWERLVLQDLLSGEQRTLIEGDGFHLARPAWIQGMRFYVWSPGSQKLYYLRYRHENASLWQVWLENGATSRIDVAPYTWISQLSISPTADQLAFIASAPSIPDRVIRWDGKTLQVEARSEPEMIPAGYLPAPQPITWKAPDGVTVHGLFYPPSNPAFSGEGLPPAIINLHGGPTSQATSRYNGEAVFFTSRGYAWLEVNYRGSSGYGRSYQNALRQRWGEVDVEDAVGAARALADQGLADAKRLVISGGSAGGYTVLNALIRHPGLFKAGICRFGVSNLFTLAIDTHKFEAHYNDSLVGTLPEAAARYHAWSPAYHADRIRDPVAIFQGSDDRVVPPAQSEEIVRALTKNAVPHLYRLYEGEGHGFRKSETRADFLIQTERFLQQYVLFSP